MDGKVFGSVFMLALLAGGLGVWQHFNTVTVQKDDLRELRTLITNSQSRLDRKKADLESIQSKVVVAQAVIDLDQEKKLLTGQISQLESSRADAQQKLMDTLNQVRTGAVGTEWPDVTLLNGQVISGVKIQKCTDTDVALSHNGGVVKLPVKDLPEDLKARLGYGIVSLSSAASP